jgi:hypothetical protein
LAHKFSVPDKPVKPESSAKKRNYEPPVEVFDFETRTSGQFWKNKHSGNF